jgi:hypothetical protein
MSSNSRYGWHAPKYSEGRAKRRRLHPCASTFSTSVSISNFTGRMPANQRALDHSQSSAYATRPRRTGFAWMYSIMNRSASALVMFRS